MPRPGAFSEPRDSRSSPRERSEPVSFRGTRAALATVGLAAALLVPVPARSTDCSLESLESTAAKVLWRHDKVYRAWAGDDLLLQNRSGLRSVEPSSGRLVWEYRYDLGEYDRLPAVLPGPGWIAVRVTDESIRFLDRSTGAEIKAVGLGLWIYDLVGPPLVAILDGPGEEQSSLVRFDEHLEPTERLVVPALELPGNPVVSGGVVALERDVEGADPDSRELVGYSLDPLEERWSIPGFTFNTQQLDGLLYVGDVSWSNGAVAIDASTGFVRRQVPPRDPYSMGGSKEFDLQVVSTKWTGRWQVWQADCEELRRNDLVSGSTKWVVALPFGVTSTLRDGGTLFVAGRRDPEHVYLVALDLETGELLRAWSDVPLGGTLRKRADVVYVFELAQELAAVDVSEMHRSQ